MNTARSGIALGLLFGLLATQASGQSAARLPVTPLPALEIRGSPDTGYAVGSAATATKTETPVLDLPFSLQVVPQSIIQDQQAYRLQDVLRNVSNTASVSSNPGYETLLSRGFTTDPFLDGNKTYFLVVPVGNAEQVEVLKGPAAAIYGRIEPGGLVNVVTRKPRFEAEAAVEQQFGSHGLRRTQVDLTGPLGRDRSFAYRLNVEYQDNDTFRNFETFKREFVSPSIAWQPSPDTRIDASYVHRRDAHNSAWGIPALGDRPAPVDRSRNYGEPGFDNEYTVDALYLHASHRIDDRWTLKGGLAAWEGDYKYALVGFNTPRAGSTLIDRFYLVSDNDRRNTRNANLDLVGKLTWGDVRHTVLLGLDYAKFDEVSDWFGDNTGKFGAPAIDIFNPAFGQVPSASRLLQETPDAYFVRSESSFGINLQDQMNFGDRWLFLIGGRHDRARASSGFDVASFAAAEAARVETRTNRFSPRAGVVFKATPAVSIYGSYAESFGTNNGGRAADGQPFKPETAQQYEAGIKSEWLGGRLAATVALFQLTKQNILTNDVANPGFSVAIGEARSRGMEIDVSGQLDPRTSLIGSLALTRAVVRRNTAGNEGHSLENVPRASGSLSLNHRASDAISFGGGLHFAGERQGDLANSFQLPGYSRVDLHAAYRWKAGPSQLTAQLNLNNVFDRKYYAASGGTGDILAGEPRTLMGSLRAEF